MSSKWERYAVLGGFWFVLLSLVGSMLFGTPPDPDSSASELHKFCADTQARCKCPRCLGDTVRVLYTFSGTINAASNFGLFVFLTATVVLTLRGGLFPRWTAYVGGLSALLFLVGTGAVANDAPFFLLIGGLLAYLVWLVWIVAGSVVMWRPART